MVAVLWVIGWALGDAAAVQIAIDRYDADAVTRVGVDRKV